MSTVFNNNGLLTDKGVEYFVNQIAAGQVIDFYEFKVFFDDTLTDLTDDQIRQTTAPTGTEVSNITKSLTLEAYNATTILIKCDITNTSGSSITINQIGIYNDTGDLIWYGIFPDTTIGSGDTEQIQIPINISAQ